MKACFAVSEQLGLNSPVYNHFGSAPGFIIVDTETGEATPLVNEDRDHQHGQCSPVRALGGAQIDAVIVGGIGAGALNKLVSLGMTVFKAGAGTVQDNLTLLKAQSLNQFNPAHVCGGHAHGGTCSHH